MVRMVLCILIAGILTIKGACAADLKALLTNQKAVESNIGLGCFVEAEGSTPANFKRCKARQLSAVRNLQFLFQESGPNLDKVMEITNVCANQRAHINQLIDFEATLNCSITRLETWKMLRD